MADEKLCPSCGKPVKVGELEIWDLSGRKWHWLCTQKVLMRFEGVTKTVNGDGKHSNNLFGGYGR